MVLFGGGGGGLGLNLGPDGITPSLGIGVGAGKIFTASDRQAKEDEEPINMTGDSANQGQTKNGYVTYQKGTTKVKGRDKGLSSQMMSEAANNWKKKAEEKDPKWWQAIEKMLKVLWDFLTIPLRIVEWIIHSPFLKLIGAAFLGILAWFLFLMNVEGYYNSLIMLGFGDFALVSRAGLGVFAFVASAAVQTYQSFKWAGLARKGKKLDADIARKMGWGAVVAIAIDVLSGYVNYPIFGVLPGIFALNCIMLLFHVFGADFTAAGAIILLDRFKEHYRKWQ